MFSSGVCRLGCSCQAAWLAALLCAVVRFGDVFLCAVSRVLWCCVAVQCRAVARRCPASFAGGVCLCPSPVCVVPCCAACRVVRCCFGLRCRWCLALWCVAVCCGASLGVLWCGGAALVCRGVLLCRAAFCGAVSPCGAVLLGCVVRFALLRVLRGPLKTILRFLKKKKKLYSTQLTHAGRQQYRGNFADLRVAARCRGGCSCLQGVERVSPRAGYLS